MLQLGTAVSRIKASPIADDVVRSNDVVGFQSSPGRHRNESGLGSSCCLLAHGAMPCPYNGVPLEIRLRSAVVAFY